MPRRFIASPPHSLKVLLLLGSFVPAYASLHAQFGGTPPATPDVQRPGLPRPDDEDPFRDNPGLRDRLQRGRAADRQRRIVDDANRLVALTAQYHKALDAHGTPTDEDQKLLVQIEKLARDVKDRMRGM